MKYLSILLAEIFTCDILKMYIASKTLLLNYKMHFINANNGIIFFNLKQAKLK